MKKAFTMLELVFVIVIMGIVASIGAEIIAKLYENYLTTRSINKLQFQTDLVLEKIAKRLTHRIKDSVIGQKMAGVNQIVTLSSADADYPIIAWVGKSYESFLGNKDTTGWTGFVDLYSNNTTATQIISRGSNFSHARDTIYALSYGNVDINNTLATAGAKAVIIFKGKDDYDVFKYGWNGTNTNDANYTYNIEVNSSETLKLNKNIETAYEQYDLAWTAYAIVPEPQNSDDFNLTLKYNFQPWDGDDYEDGESSVLMEHVSSFKFMQYGETIRLKLCIRDDKTGGDYGFCKEKVVF